MSQYQNDIADLSKLIAEQGSSWDAISPESAARMRLQNRFRVACESLESVI